jgi:hypothetical protein
MSRLDDLTEAIVSTGRVDARAAGIGEPNPVAFWRGEDVGIVFSLVQLRDGGFIGLTTDARRESDGSWSATGLVIEAPVPDAFERPPQGSLDVFAAHGLSFHLALPGVASRDIVEVELETGSAPFLFPVSEPLGFFLAVVPEPSPGTEVRLTGRPGDARFVYVVSDVFEDAADERG